jgi:nucleoside-triphosphate--adenylate kinase
MDEGKLVPDNIIINLITNEVSNRSSRSIPILLDGFPRTLEQAKALNESFPVDVTLRLDVLHDTIIDRMSQRWVHAPSGRTYSYDYKPPRHVGLDDVTGEPLSQREEDTPEFIKRRLEDYETMIFPLISYYESNPTCMMQTFQGTDPDKMYHSVFEFLANELIVPCFPAKKSRVKKGK